MSVSLAGLWRFIASLVRFPFLLVPRLRTLEATAIRLQSEQAQLVQAQNQFTQTQAQLVQAQNQLLQDQHQLTQTQQQLAQDQSQLTQALVQLRRDHDASVGWLQTTYPEIVSAIGKKIEPQQFDQLTQDVFAAMHRELGALGDRIAPLESNGNPQHPATGQEDSRSAGFYLALERRFRGTADEITARAQPYLDLLQTSPCQGSPLLDIGSGRGEWLALLAQAGLSASGIDLNPINGDYCRSRGLDVHTGDALAHLQRLPDHSLGCVTAFHLVEHLPFAVLLAITDEILRVLQPGGLLIYETPNPENLQVAMQSFWIDPTHLRPLPPDLLQFLLLQRGFACADIRRLHPAAPAATADATLQALLSGPRDYAVVARKATPDIA